MCSIVFYEVLAALQSCLGLLKSNNGSQVVQDLLVDPIPVPIMAIIENSFPSIFLIELQGP